MKTIKYQGIEDYLAYLTYKEKLKQYRLNLRYNKKQSLMQRFIKLFWEYV